MLHWRVNRRTELRPIIPTAEIERELYAIYAQTFPVWRALFRAIVAGWTLPAEIVTDADGTELTWLVDQAKAELDRTIIYQTEQLGRWVTRVGAWHGQKTISGLKSATGTDVAPFISLGDVRETLENSIRQNVSLISVVNADTKNRVEQIIFDGFARRMTKKEITRELAKALGITQRRARIISSDQTHKLNIALTKYRNLQLGISSYIWRTRRDDRVRPAHRAREGKMFRWDAKEPPLPGYEVGCRCVGQSVIYPED
jgi:SPP1 gp7 family putative phage head morphogenesis protein